VLFTKYCVVRSTDLGDEVEKNEMEVRHITHMWKRRKAYSVLVNNPERKMPLEDLRMDGRLILKFVVKGKNSREWTGFIWLKMGTSGGLL